MQPQGQGQPSWMNGAIGAGVAVVAVLALAIGYVLVTDDGDDGGDTTAGAGNSGDDTSTTAEYGDPGEVNLRDALLTVDDFSEGEWTEVPTEPPAGDNEYEEIPDCELMYEILREDDDENAYVRNFDQGDTIWVSHYLHEPSGDSPTVAGLIEAMELCPEYSFTYGDNPATTAAVSQEILARDEFGETSVAYSRQFHFVSDDGTESYGATFRVGWERDGVYSNVLYVEDQLAGDEDADYLQSETEELAEIADSRLVDLLGG